MSKSTRVHLSRFAGLLLSGAALVLVVQPNDASARGDIPKGCLECLDGDETPGSCVLGRHRTESWHGREGGIAHTGYPYSDCLVGSCEDLHPVNPDCSEGGALALSVPLDSVISTVAGTAGGELL